MNIHYLWYICILIRFGLIFFIKNYYKKYKQIILIPLIIGTGFIYKNIYGSNNEIQINKVFWHETRLLHGILYLSSFIYLYNKNINMFSTSLFLDIILSIIYRFY